MHLVVASLEDHLNIDDLGSLSLCCTYLHSLRTSIRYRAFWALSVWFLVRRFLDTIYPTHTSSIILKLACISMISILMEQSRQGVDVDAKSGSAR